MIKKGMVWVFLALMHLVLVNLFIWTNFENKETSGIYEYLRIYRDFSGCFRDYSYFAPNVANDTRAGFITKTEQETLHFLSFRAENEVVNTRYNNVISSGMRNPEVRELFSRSWATAIFGRDEKIQEVTVFAEAYLVPSIAEYRAGERPFWKVIYVGSFEKNKGEGFSKPQ
ncbi:MAG TPA: hypothetical protein VKN36_11480 [Eudoraea sp.]|nr:hypothetical protein [Eudoraea sp.]